MILCFWTDRSGQTVQTQIRLLLEEQSSLFAIQFANGIVNSEDPDQTASLVAV